MSSHQRADLLVMASCLRPSPPIERLPPEILTEIFLLAHLYCLHDSTTDHDADLSHVCRSWRQLALDMPLLWSHVDIVLDNRYADIYYERALIWIERSAGVLLDIDIKSIEDEAKLQPRISKMVAFLTPFADRVRCCKVSCGSHNCRSEFMVRQIMYVIESTVISETSGILNLWAVKSVPNISWRWFPPPTHSIAPLLSHNAEPAPPIRVLRLENTFHMRCFSGLTELYLEFPESSQNRFVDHDITWILKCNPTLCVLSLINFGIIVGQDSTSDPISFNDLQYLTIISSSAETFTKMLPLLAPVKQPLSMTASVIPNPHYLDAMRSFFSRSNTVDLHCTSPRQAEGFSAISTPSP